MSVGIPLPHDSAPLHVTGRARYVDDQPVPAGTLHLAFGLSTVAHGDITGMDLSAVRVVCVVETTGHAHVRELHGTLAAADMRVVG